MLFLAAVYIWLAYTSQAGVLWVLILIFGAFLVAAGYQLAPLLGVLPLWFRQVWDLMLAGLARLAHLLTWLVAIVVALLEHLFYVFAAPLNKILGTPGVLRTRWERSRHDRQTLATRAWRRWARGRAIGGLAPRLRPRVLRVV